jgi:two-component system sensor kinase FixL
MKSSAEEQLERRLMFETLLSEISTGLINLPAEKIDNVIQDTQRRVCELLDLDFSALWQLSLEEPRFLYQSHVHRPSGGPHLPKKMGAEENYPWVLEQLKSGNIVAISTEEAPKEAARDQEVWRHYGVKSSLTFPLSAGGEDLLFGALSFGTMREERVWPESLIKQLELLAQIFANSIHRKRTDHALRESERRLKQATDAAKAGLWIMNTETGDVWVSERIRDLFHFLPHEKVTYERFFTVIHPDDHQPVRQAVERALQSGEKFVTEYRILYADGGIRWIVVHGQRYGAAKPFRLMGVSFDNTERMNAEAEARKQWEHLAHVTRMGLMGELTASLAHEINQPLTAIQSNAEAAVRFMAASEPDTDEVCQILEDISRDNARASSIISKIRAMLKKEPIHFTVLDVNDLIADVLSLLRADSILRELVIIRDFSPELPPVFGDRVQLQQVIINLILNGAAAMKQVPPARRRLEIKTENQNESAVKVSVADFGTGIDEQNAQTLFEPFYTTKPHGMGMGLAISQTIIREHGGTICASNHPEGGAVFAFTLSVQQGDPA